ncbi:MAG: NAD(P)H-hydrate epimerase [Actinomycetota bacterium]|nr:NAD(P)H-hydrate epimerase [Actinomycetota bacterium]
MREVDRIMVEELGIGLHQMMENAGRALARRARLMLGGDAAGQRVTVLAGPGGNGGGGMVAARRLSIWGAEVTVILGQPDGQLAGVPAQQLSILRRMGLSVLEPEPHLPAADLIIDALIGYSLTGAPRSPISELIDAANAAGVPILALDIPSGLDSDRGVRQNPCISAAGTLTLALPKIGLLQRSAMPAVGELFLADISVPAVVYGRIGLQVADIFARDDVVALR